MNKKTQQIESLLFYLNEEVGKKRLADMAGVSLAELEESIAEIKELRKEGGIVLLDTATSVSLGTHPDCSDLIQSINDAEKVSPLSKAALETLSVILYQAPVTRAEVDTVRGVNSLYSVRNLLVRGLVSRRTIEGKVVYEPTIETMQLLGISDSKELPNYNEVLQNIDQIIAGQTEKTVNEPQVESSKESEPKNTVTD